MLSFCKFVNNVANFTVSNLLISSISIVWNNWAKNRNKGRTLSFYDLLEWVKHFFVMWSIFCHRLTLEVFIHITVGLSLAPGSPFPNPSYNSPSIDSICLSSCSRALIFWFECLIWNSACSTIFLANAVSRRAENCFSSSFPTDDNFSKVSAASWILLLFK